MAGIIGRTVSGLLLGGGLAFGAGLAWLTLINTDNREGAAAMGVVFFVTPAGALIGAACGLIWGIARWRGGRNAQ